jgi:translation initiation factor 2B subunit (eIF-2B alpha/beta/delta family)
MQPRITALNHMLEQFEEDIKPYLGDEPEVLKNTIIRILKEKVRLYESRAELVVRNGMQFVENGDGIIVHSASWVVRNILIQAKKVMLKDFSVSVLQLDAVRTPQIVRFLREEEIPHKVIPAFNLCHYVEQANKILLGAVSITNDMKVVAPVGTSTTLSLCRYKNIKSYLFASSFHFSHWHGEFQSIHRRETSVADPCASYDLTTHSHDLVDMELIDVLVDEDGVVDDERLRTYAG